ncbi:MAG: glycosyl hydrolase [Pirellulales bacterium]
MNRSLLTVSLAAALAISAALATPEIASAADSTGVKAIFTNPPREYSSSPLWVWNDMLTEDQVVGTLRDLAGQKVRQVFVHPRPGLMTPYLSPEWFRLWKIALKEAERLDMNVWIYDENSYPSGFAGGHVPEVMPESRGRGLVFREVKQPGKPGNNVLGVYRLTGAGYEDVTKKAQAGESLPEGRYLMALVQRAANSPWHGGRSYVDLLYPGVTEKFLDITLGAYQREIGDQFGKRVPGSFTDEPELRPAGGLPWTDHLPQEFQKRWGYSLLENLPSLTRPVGDWRRVRHNYFQVLLEQFIEHWGKPYYDDCQRRGLEFTGHYWEHEWPECLAVPDNMAMSAWQHRPGIDTLMNQYAENTHAQFGNVRAVKEISSLANQLGRRRTLCEIYGAGGWDLRFEDMKRIADWLEVLGINTLDEHLSYVTLRGARKHDHPQSFSYHEPWWDSYHVMAEYTTRVSAVLSQGEQVNSVLVLEPTTAAWLYQNDSTQAKKLGQLGDQFFDLLMQLERAQCEYDLGCEDVIARHGSVAAKASAGGQSGRSTARFVVGRRSYRLVVLPPGTENLNSPTMERLEQYLAAGGRVLCCGAPPALIDGRPSDRGQQAAKQSGWKQVEAAAVAGLLQGRGKNRFAVRRAEGDKGILFHQRRRLDDGQVVFLVNTSIESPSVGVIESAAKGVEQWNAETGAVQPYAFTSDGQGVKAAFELPPCGSLLLFLSNKPCQSAAVKPVAAVEVKAAGPIETSRVAPNVLTLDYLDVTAGGETKKNAYFYAACQFAFVKNGMERNPWDSAVQFGDELISKKFPATSGVEATYRFTITKQVPAQLFAVIERPDLYTVTLNDKPIAAGKDSWWLDKAFGKIDIAAAAKVGENALTIKAAPFTIYHELQSAYILGDFALEPAKSGFTIVPAKPLALGAWRGQGLPFYAAGMSYKQKFGIPSPAGKYVVEVPSWYGSVAKVIVNGGAPRHLVHRPWQCDITDLVKPGANTVEVVVVGTLKNTLGPHHGKPGVGTAWPGMFHVGPENGPPPGESYSTLDYGLLAPFTVKQLK